MAETTTISNLPQITIDELTNDTLVPVENVDGTKAANLAQLRKKLNSLYVEMVDADLNELKQDGIYECLGTTLNAPTSEVAAWIIQTAEHEGVVVQNAFGLGTTSYSYVYRRRWNGVSWTAWENKIQTLETVKANVSNTVTTDTEQTITGLKVFNNGSGNNRTNILVVTDDGVAEDANTKWAGSIQFKKGNLDVGYCEAMRDSANSSIAQIVAHNSVNGQRVYANLKAVVTSDGTTFGTAPTTPDNAPANAIVTKDKIANMVTTNTAQTITGTKTFKYVVTAELEPINFIAKNPTMDVNATPSSRKYVGYDFRDKNNVRIGYIGISQGTDGTFQYEFQKLGNYANKMIGITPPVNSSGTEIVTAGWFNSKMQVVSALPATPDANVFYFIPG